MAVAQARHDERMQRVSRAHPCPICGHTDWCAYTSYLVYCMRSPVDPFGRPGREHPSGGWIHRPPHGWTPPPPERSGPSGAVRKAAPEVLDRWYRALIAELSLAPAHAEHLRGRGLRRDTIARRGYRTLPAGRRIEIARRVIDRVGQEPIGVPGFYRTPKGAWVLAGPAGLLIPIEDRAGRIVGCQIRVERATEGSRYRWLSSAQPGRDFGSSPGVPRHIARAPEGRESPVVVVTEGPLKADYTAQERGHVVIANPGVAVLGGILEDIPAGASWVVVAYDMDRQVKHEVRFFTERLVRLLVEAGLKVGIASWDPRYKGIDDAILAGSPIEVRPVRR